MLPLSTRQSLCRRVCSVSETGPLSCAALSHWLFTAMAAPAVESCQSWLADVAQLGVSFTHHAPRLSIAADCFRADPVSPRGLPQPSLHHSPAGSIVPTTSHFPPSSLGFGADERSEAQLSAQAQAQGIVPLNALAQLAISEVDASRAESQLRQKVSGECSFPLHVFLSHQHHCNIIFCFFCCLHFKWHIRQAFQTSLLMSSLITSRIKCPCLPTLCCHTAPAG